MERPEEQRRLADLLKRENSGVQSIIEIGGEVSNLVGEVDQLRFKRRKQIEIVGGELGVFLRFVIARVLHNSLANGEGQVEPAKAGIALFKPRDDAQGVQIVVEAEPVGTKRAVESLFARVAKWRMADIVREGEGLGKLRIQAESRGNRAGDLRHFQGMRETAAEVVAEPLGGQAREDLRLAGEAAECARMQNTRGVAGERGAIGVGQLGVNAARRFVLSAAADGNCGRQLRGRFLFARNHECGLFFFTSGYTANRDDWCRHVDFCARSHRVQSHRPVIKHLVTAGWTTPSLREYHPAGFFEGLAQAPKRVCASSRYGPQWEGAMKLIKGMSVLAALATVLLSGCARHSVKEVYYLVGSNMSSSYWQTAVAGFKKAAADYQVTAKTAGPDNYDPQTERTELQNAVAAKPNGILVSVSDVGVLQPAIDAAVNAGVPVITVDSDAAASKRLYFIGTNNLDAGRLGARRVVEKLGGKGSVVFFTIAGQPNTEERLKGFKDVFSTQPGIKIAEVVDIKGAPVTAFDRTQQLLAQTGDKKISAFVCLDSVSGKMVADAVKRSGDTSRELVAWDVNPDTLQAIKDGVIDATVAQKPFTMGYVGLKALDDVFHDPPAQLGKDYSADAFAPYPAFVDTGTAIVDKSNVDGYLAAAQAHAQ